MTGLKSILAGLAAALLLAAPVAAHVVSDHGGSLEMGGMSEKQLRTFETEVLGPEHAAEHARMRQAIKTGRVRAADTGPVQAAAVVPSFGGEWAAPFSIPVIGINAVMLPTGRVLWFAYPKNANKQYNGNVSVPNQAQGFIWDPARGTGPSAFKRVDPPLWRDPADGKMKPANIWCSGQALLPDGRVVVTGGNLAYTAPGGNFKGLNKVYTFNPWNETWTEQPDMGHGRWYPSQLLMRDGRMLIVGGLDESGATYSPDRDVEIFTPSPDLNGRGTIQKFGERTTSGDATLPPDGGLYPHLFWMPSGRAFVAGPHKEDSWFLHTPPLQPWNTLAGHWDDVPNPSLRRVWGSAVLVPDGPAGSKKVEQVGGSNPLQTPGMPTASAPATKTTETYTEPGGSSTNWQAGAPMQVARSHLNTVLLPDLSMVSVGGGIGVDSANNQWAVSPNHDERQVDVFDPSAQTWHLGAAAAEDRAYHSTAVLMPDGKVVSAGDDYNGSTGPGSGLDTDTAQVFSPPYLFKGSRPTISSAPDWVSWGQKFTVGTPDGNITSAVLVAPGATTHANDMSQRVVPLARNSTTGELTAPANENIAPPGYYMLYLVNAQGVPSAARWVSLSWTAVPKRTPPVWPDPPAASPPKAPAKVTPSGKPSDSKGPSIFFSRSGFNARRGRVSGRVSDASGVKSFKVGLARKGKRCRWWSRSRGRLARLGSCRRPVWIKAKLKRKGKSVLWSVTLRGRVPRGHYLVALRAVDGHGNVTTRSGTKAAKISVR